MPSPALAAALALASAPTLAQVMRLRPLPDGVGELLGVFARREDDIAALLDDLALDRAMLADCVDNYIQKIVLHPGGTPYRMLAGTPASSRAQLRRHMKLLLEGLHPDKAGGSWKASYAPRVIEAWREVSSGRAIPGAPPPAKANRRLRLLPWIAHPIPRQGRKWSWRIGLALLAAVSAIAFHWRSMEASLLDIAGSLSP